MGKTEMERLGADLERFEAGLRRRRETIPELVGQNEIAQRLGVKQATVAVWRYRRDTLAVPMPEPDLMLSGSPLWLWETILDWAKLSGRLNAAAS